MDAPALSVSSPHSHGLLRDVSGKRVYIDASVFMAHFDQLDGPQGILCDLMAFLKGDGFIGMTSGTVLTEILPPLLVSQDGEVVSKIASFILNSCLFQLSHTFDEVDTMAKELHAKKGLSVIDAVQVAKALHYEADIYLTNKPDLDVPKPLKRLLLSDYL